VSCARLARYAEELNGLRLVLADEEPTATEEEMFDEVVELPPP